MSQFLMICTFMVVKGLASDPPENALYVPAKAGETPSCDREGLGFCQDVENYPEQLILKLLKTTPPELTKLFENNVNHNTSEVKGPGLYSEYRRQDDVPDQLCKTLKKSLIVRAMRNVNNEWRYIVNVKGHSRPPFNFEYCDPEGECDCSSYLQPGTVGCCTQKRMMTKELSLHPSGEKLYLEGYLTMTCCECTLYTSDTICKCPNKVGKS